MVGEEVLEDLSLINNLPESAGAMAALKAKADFQRVPHFFGDPIDIRRSLIAFRERKGAETPAGYAASTIIEQLAELPGYVRQPWATHPCQTLPFAINYQIGRLERRDNQ